MVGAVHRAVLAAVAVVLAASMAPPAKAELPAAKLLTAPAVASSAAWAWYLGDSTRTTGVAAWPGTPPEIKALARSLGAERLTQGKITADQYAQNVYDYVRNNIEVEFRFGLAKGGRGALIDQSGTPFDQAELMVKLLREAPGVTASYQVGDIALTAQQFGQWSGLVKNLNQATQTFDVDARSACQFLADGGVPATVGGANDCAALSGNLSAAGTPVIMSHIWVSTGGKAYDPSFKIHALKTGIDLSATMLCGAGATACGDAIVAAGMAGAQTGTAAGLPYIQSVNEAGLNAKLLDFATKLQASIQTTDRLATAQDIVGGRLLIPTARPPIAAALPYASGATTTLSGEIPNRFRTTLRVRYGSESLYPGADQTFFADELSGRRLQLGPEGPMLDGAAVTYSNCSPECTAYTIWLDVDHPYRAGGGTYADDHAELMMIQGEGGTDVPQQGTFPVTIVHGFGEASAFTERQMSALQEAGSAAVQVTWTLNNKQTRIYFSNLDQPTLPAKLRNQGSAADALVAGMARAPITRHHDIGIVYAHSYSPSSISELSVQSALSVNSATLDAGSRTAAFETAAATWAMLEGSVNQQANNTPTGVSTSSLFAALNRNSVQFTQQTAAQLAAKCPGSVGDYCSRLRKAGAAGYDAILLPGSGMGGSEIFSRAGATAYTIYAAMKGGGALEPNPPQKAMDSVKMNEKAADRKKYLAISPASGDVTMTETDLVTGAGDFPESLPFTRTYTSEPSVTDVTEMIQTDWEILSASASGGSVAYSQRYSGPDSSAKARLGGGWNHNYNVTASVSGNGDKAFGSESALDASASIAMLWSFYGASRTPTFASRLTSTIGMNWLATQLAFNAAVVDKGGAVDSFQRLPDGSFNTLGAGRLVQTGAPTLTQDWSGVTLRYTGADGDTIDFIPGYWSRHHYDTGGDLREKAEPSFIATYWTFPDGNKVSFEYTTAWMQTSWSPYIPPSCTVGDGTCNWSAISNMPWGYVLHKVSNSRGRSLTFEVVPTTLHVCCTLNGTDFNVTSTFRISRVTDESGRHADYSLDCTGFACGTLTAKAPDTKETRYSYTPGADSPDSSAVRPSYRLRRWYTPGDLTHAYQTVAYDELYRARTLTDILQRVTNYYPGAVAGSELWKRSEVVDPLGLSSVSLFDQWNSVQTATDPLGRIKLTTYDGARRKVEETNPDKDRVGYAYDVRGNVLTTTRYPKPGSNLASTTVTTDYVEASTVWNCVTPVTCNKPKSEDGPRTDVTDISNYAWNGTTGNLTQILKPGDALGARPQIDLEYTNYSGASGATLSLLSKKTVKVDGARSSVTTYDYDTANKLVLKTSTVDQGDPSHLNLRTCFKFDTYGGLTQVTNPRATTCP